MLTNVLPGLREIRAPLVSGYLWLVFLFVVLHSELPSRRNAGSTLKPIFELADDLSVLGLATVTGVAAYLVGSSAQELWKLLARLVAPQRPFYGEVGVRTSAAGRRDIRDAVRIRVQGVNRELFQVALAPGEKGIDEEPSAETVERELPLVRTLLLGERPELVSELDRLQAEADLRITVAFPLVFFAAYLGWKVSWGWASLAIPAILLLIQGIQRQQEAGDLLAKALRIGKADAPALESLSTAATAVLERVELEGELRKRMDEEDAMAAFRLGNLQSSWDDLEAATKSLDFAAEQGIVRAYAELGLVYERREDTKSAERAFRDGSERGDGKAAACLSGLLNRQDRDEEALLTVEPTGERAALSKDSVAVEEQPDDPDREAHYRVRAEAGDAKAAINLGLLLARRGDREGAVTAFRRATESDPDDPQAWMRLGVATETANRFAAARDAYEKALEIQERELGPEHLDVGITLAGLGSTLRYLGRYEDATRAFERALAIEERELGPASARVGATLGWLADARMEMGDLAGARSLFERALDIKEREFGPDHPVTANAMADLGVLFDELGDLNRARGLLEIAAKMTEERMGRDSLVFAEIEADLADVLGALGRHGQARQMLEHAVGIGEGKYGPDALEMSETFNSLSCVLAPLGELEEAQEMALRALAIAEAQLPPDHPWIGQVLDTVAESHYLASEYGAAEILYRRAIANLSASEAARGMRAIPFRGLGRALFRMERIAEAKVALERALALQRDGLPPEHPDLVETLKSLAAVEEAIDGEGAAAELWREAEEIEKRDADR